MTDLQQSMRIPDRLQQMYAMQRQLQIDLESVGVDPKDLPSPSRMNYVRTMVLSLEDELHEALKETGWKPWATSNHLHRDAFMGEMVDAWHFFMNLMLVADMTPEDLYKGYMAKHTTNRIRQAEGYDGVTSKCPGCHRAYDDTAVRCMPEEEQATDLPGVSVPIPRWCDHKQTHINEKGQPLQ